MISRIEAYNYRCFRALSVDLDRYQVLAGANGAGKTTLLDIPILIGDLLQQRTTGAFLERSQKGQPPRATTLTELLHKGQGDMIAFAIEAKLPASVVETLSRRSAGTRNRSDLTHVRYELRLEVREQMLRVADEYLFLFSDKIGRPGSERRPPNWQYLDKPAIGYFWGLSNTLLGSQWFPVILRHGERTTQFVSETTTQAPDVPELRVPTAQLALAAVPPDPTYFPAALWFAELLSSGAVFYSPQWDELRRAAPPGDPPRLLASGRNAPWLALRLQQRDPAEVASWVELVRTALPQVADIRAVEREEDHYAYFSVDYVGGYNVTSSGLSDGTLRILALTLLPFLSEEAMPGLLVTEEPENGIHPRAIETVVQSLGSLYDSQVWVSTQSPQVLAHTDLGDVLVSRIENDGSVSVLRGREHPRLRDWHGSLDIGTLFAAGILS